MGVEYDSPWRRAVKKFENSKFSYEEIITHDWLLNAFDLDEPTSDTLEEYHSKKINNTQQFITHLLKEKKIYLQNVKGVGYKLVPPSSQTALAMHNYAAALKARTEKAVEELTNIDTEQLTAYQKRANRNAVATVLQVKQFARENVKIPKLKDK